MDNSIFDDVRHQLDKDIEKDLHNMYDLKRTDSTNFDNFSEKNQSKDSLAIIIENRYDLLEKLKKNWYISHQRIKDFKQKKLQKFQQIYHIKYMFIYDPKNKIYQKRIHALSKYTVKYT